MSDKISFTPDELVQLRMAMLNEYDDRKSLRHNAAILWGAHHARTVEEAAKQANRTRRTIYHLYDRYAKDGLEGLVNKQGGGAVKIADEQYEQHLKRIVDSKPQQLGLDQAGWTVKMLQAEMELRYSDIEMSDKSFRRMLHRLGYVYRLQSNGPDLFSAKPTNMSEARQLIAYITAKCNDTEYVRSWVKVSDELGITRTIE